MSPGQTEKEAGNALTEHPRWPLEVANRIVAYLRRGGFSPDYLRIRASLRGARDSKVTGVVMGYDGKVIDGGTDD